MFQVESRNVKENIGHFMFQVESRNVKENIGQLHVSSRI